MRIPDSPAAVSFSNITDTSSEQGHVTGHSWAGKAIGEDGNESEDLPERYRLMACEDEPLAKRIPSVRVACTAAYRPNVQAQLSVGGMAQSEDSYSTCY